MTLHLCIPETKELSGVQIIIEPISPDSNRGHHYHLKLIEIQKGKPVNREEADDDFYIFPDEIDRLIAGLKRAKEELVLLSL